MYYDIYYKEVGLQKFEVIFIDVINKNYIIKSYVENDMENFIQQASIMPDIVYDALVCGLNNIKFIRVN